MNDETQPDTQKTPIFTILAGIFVAICLTTPMIFLSMPIMATLTMSAVAIVRKERPRWIAPLAAALAIVIVIGAGAQIDETLGTSTSNLSSANIEDWSWTPDPDFGTDGTIKWRVVVRNTSDRAIESVKVNFSTYDKDQKLLTSTFSYVQAIPPNGNRTDESYADLYGTEEKANVEIVAVRFSGD